MSAFKRRLVHAALIVFALWPAAHIALVRRYDVNPWKLAGWGMYSAPQIPCTVRVLGLTPDDVGLYELRTFPAGLERQLDAFLRRRHGLRRLAAPDDLGRALLEHYTAVDGVDVVVVQPYLERRTGMIEEAVATYAYRRERGR